ncbi:Na+/H+ antiporter subunit E [Betaproteobacteria bacterium]|nr:Na+/H+ antiporter subunit E [Betaproteobacteria bacterium]
MAYISGSLFIIFWLIFSGIYEPLTLSLGVVSVLIVTTINSLLKLSVESKGSFSYRKFFAFYLPWLLKEIVVSGIKTSGAILGFRKFKTRAKKIKASQRTPLGTMIYGNSITLTPGTLTVEVGQGDLFVHALCDRSLNELEFGEMDKRVSDLEK